MKISVFTPTHARDLTHLRALYESMRDQPFHEWVIVVNGPAMGHAEEIAGWDRRIGVVKSELEGPQAGYVGALKKIACERCSGDVFLEVDHDDLLMPGAVERVAETFSRNPNVGFVYSNTVEFTGDFDPQPPYNSAYGWRYRPFPYRGKQLVECISFKPSAVSVSHIWFAPNHLRAWRSDAYRRAGGHDPGMRVLDDLDLLCRTYLVTEMVHLDEPLYLYRITGNNTWIEHNAEIQNGVLDVYNRYIYRLAARWAELSGLLKLDLGGRIACQPGYTSVDLRDGEIIHDLNQPWPFADGSVGVIIANEILEHLRDPLFVMQEIHRVLAHGGLLIATVPSTDGRGAFENPAHVSFWNENSFLYYTEAPFAGRIGTPVRFQKVQLYTSMPSQWHVEKKIAYVFTTLLALKPGGERFPGILQI